MVCADVLPWPNASGAALPGTSWHFGGTSAISGGAVWLYGTDQARAAGAEDSPEAMRTYLKHVIGNGYDAALADAFIEQGHQALRWLEKGLRYEPRNRRLNEIRESLGLRRKPPVPFLQRSNPVNVMLGQVLHRYRQMMQDREEEKREEESLERAEARALAHLRRNGRGRRTGH